MHPNPKRDVGMMTIVVYLIDGIFSAWRSSPWWDYGFPWIRTLTTSRISLMEIWRFMLTWQCTPRASSIALFHPMLRDCCHHCWSGPGQNFSIFRYLKDFSFFLIRFLSYFFHWCIMHYDRVVFRLRLHSEPRSFVEFHSGP